MEEEDEIMLADDEIDLDILDEADRIVLNEDDLSEE